MWLLLLYPLRYRKNPRKPDIVILESHKEFKRTVLKTSSVIRLDKIATIAKDLILGEIGEVGPVLKREINLKLEKIYKL